MRIVKGNNTEEMTKSALDILREQFLNTEVDLGTGDGQYIFKNADLDKNTLFIGVDPAQKQLEVYSRKCVRKKLKNALFIPGSFENFPEELNGSADIVHILFPWGTLLQTVVKPTEAGIKKLRQMLKNEVGELEIVLGYSPDTEPSESLRLELPELTLKYIQDIIVPVFESQAFKVLSVKEMDKAHLKDFGTTWSKKLHFGKDRPVYYLRFASE